MKHRLALAVIPAALALTACDTTRVTQTFGEVIVHAPKPPAVETSSTVVVPRTPTTHEVEVPADYTGETPILGEPAPAIEPIIAYEPCFEQPVEAPETGCSHPVSVPAVFPQNPPLIVDRFEHVEPSGAAWGRPVVPLPDSCQEVTKLDADGVVRTRSENGAQAPCEVAR